MMDQNSNCSLIEVTDAEVENSVRSIPKLDTLILVKVREKMEFSLNFVHAIWITFVGYGEKALICQPFSQYSEEEG